MWYIRVVDKFKLRQLPTIIALVLRGLRDRLEFLNQATIRHISEFMRFTVLGISSILTYSELLRHRQKDQHQCF